jgi:CHAT domain-containing protein/tetratricopeptide (TPR) repeat protein
MKLSRSAWIFALAALGGTAFIARKMRDDPSQAASRAISREYGIHRTFPIRLAGASHQPIRTQRGDRAELSPSALEAIASIRRALGAQPLEPGWLHAQGRAELVAGNPDDAIRTLEMAADLGPDTPALWSDLGAAYFVKAESADASYSYAVAIELFSRSLALTPAEPAARFNRALAYRRMNLFDAAIDDFEQLLKVESDSSWRAEAADHLAEVRKRRSLLFDPAPPAEPNADEQMDSAFGADIAAGWSGDPAARQKLAAAAHRLRTGHGDFWLEDLLHGAVPLAAEQRAAEILSALARFRMRAQIDQYDRMEPDIQWLESASLRAPFAAWRDLELLFRATHSRALAACPSTEALLSLVEARQYRAIQIQTLLERSSCRSGMGRLDESLVEVEKAVALASTHRFPTARIRAEGFLCSNSVDQGRYREAYQLARESIDEIIDHHAPIRRAHEFFNTTMRAADRLEQWNTAHAAARMAGQVAGAFASPMFEMIAGTKQADFSVHLGLQDRANREYDAALELYGKLQQTPNVAAYAATARAGIFEARKDFAGLINLRENLLKQGNLYLEGPVDVALARLALERGDTSSALRYTANVLESLESARVPGAAPSRNTFRKRLEQASALDIRARLAASDPAAAWRSWQQFLYRDAVVLGAATPFAEPDPAPGAAVITLADLQTGIGIWIRADSSVEFHWSPASRDVVLREIRKLRRLCADPHSAPAMIRQSCRFLWDALFAPALRAHPAARTLELQATGILASIPMTLLVSESAPGTLGSGVALVPFPISPSPARGERAVLVEASRSDAALGQGLPPLSDLGDEVRSIAAIVPGSERIAGADATTAALRKAAADARIFHFAGHAISWRDGIALLAAPDASESDPDMKRGLLRITPEFKLSAELALFSACSTADLESNYTALPTRLPEAALLAGARHVIGTLWNVDSRAAARFGEAFYRSWIGGLAMNEAAAAAMQSVRADKEFEHPYYWAPFALFQISNSRRKPGGAF